MNQEDAMNLLIQWLRDPNHGGYGSYGYDIYIPNLLRGFLIQEYRNDQQALEMRIRELIPVFYAVGWELCRRGILRPGVNKHQAQATEEGSAGAGYSITPFGAQWLEEADHDNWVPTEPGRFAEMLAEYRDLFGVGFHQRSQEAIKCYGAHAYVACAAMCGAAAESVILAAAIHKTDEDRVLSQYKAASGRKRIENLLVGKARTQLKDEYAGYSVLLRYWRDESAHGTQSSVQDNEAYTSLALLLRLCKFINDHWLELTQ
ncbi:MAG: hypothetical protein JAY85_06040 [Candidatus Thiodiazotropha weberae]|uniref:DUF4145 domain-containing protein n=1 Tax=Candidatus Thiodiazotropha endoloripes TaxID=1818881 RepID=A0A1E2US25_9GAMM|nr:hypothetical protein [Candidatus Thiodiazotropha endoloripes]MCG7898001.1 hypothetical protein [Candidatus Thiodiazotropha weberae]ODB86448.1 hypothetical protein A3195_12625 [Candidatus Thiodiazotropha endoloripes]ODB88479.1 hypothetical protein A3193_06415 [Candidatus Thiodiazotropha endoloripes]ODB97567.1 hypothetical protein A3196_12855 [Candidatus Thiodiazotropha endoloripes]